MLYKILFLIRTIISNTFKKWFLKNSVDFFSKRAFYVIKLLYIGIIMNEIRKKEFFIKNGSEIFNLLLKNIFKVLKDNFFQNIFKINSKYIK